jgi:sigma-E factor negative regulatory protein RseC
MNNGHGSMLEETGRVVELQGGYALIETQPRSACGHCNQGDNCGTSVLSGLFSRRRSRLRLLNHLGLQPGDQAVIGINESVLLSTAVMAYLLPLLLMIGCAVMADVLAYGDQVSFGASMLGLFAGMRITNRIMGNKDFQSREIILLRNANESPVRFTDG